MILKNPILILVCTCAVSATNSIASMGEESRVPKTQDFETIDYLKIVKSGEQDYEDVDSAIVVGAYTVVTKSDPQNQTQTINQLGRFKPIKLMPSGRIVLSEGRLVVEVVDARAGETLAADYGLDVVSELPSISRVVLQVQSLAKLKEKKAALEADYRVRSVELEVYSGGGVAQ